MSAAQRFEQYMEHLCVGLGLLPEVKSATKRDIALEQLRALREAGAPACCVIADTGYGVDSAFRRGPTQMGLPYMVGVASVVCVWLEEVEPLPPARYSGFGRPPSAPRRTARRQPMSVKALAESLPRKAFQRISWREGSSEVLSSRFAAVRVRQAGGNYGRSRLREQQWLLIEWPTQESEPLNYWLSTLPQDSALNELVAVAQSNR